MLAAFGFASVVLVVVGLAVVLSAHRRRDGTIAQLGTCSVADVPTTSSAIALLERWRDRAVRWRASVAVPAVLGSVAGNLLLRRSIDVGVGGHPAWADPLLTGLLGAFVGAIVAEAHHLRRRSGGARTVVLVPRDLAAYLPAGSRARLGRLTAAAVTTAVATLVLTDGHVPALGVLALGLLALVPVAQRGIISRARPAVAPDLRTADDAVRRLAVRSVDEAGAGAALLLIAWQLAPVYSSATVPRPIAAVLAVIQLAALVVAVVWWRRSNPDRLLPDVPAILARDRHEIAT
jgi:hypothetical protein